MRKAQCSKFWNDALSEATILEVHNPQLPWKGKAPQRIEGCFSGNTNPEFDSDIQSHYKHIFYKALDFVKITIQKHFEQPNYQIYVSLENLLLKPANKEDVTEFYDTNFDVQCLKVHLEIFGEDTQN